MRAMEPTIGIIMAIFECKIVEFSTFEWNGWYDNLYYTGRHIQESFEWQRTKKNLVRICCESEVMTFPSSPSDTKGIERRDT